MNPFTAKSDLDSYTYPVIKIFVSAGVLVLMILRNKIFSFSSKAITMVVTGLCVIISIIFIYGIYISVYEITMVKENRIHCETTMTSFNTKPYDLEDILFLIQQSDIIEIELLVNGSIIKIGASCDSLNAASPLIEKKYFYKVHDIIFG